MTPQQIEERIREIFEENYELLRLEGGHALTEDIRNYALNQVIFYYKKMKEVAEKVSETEVKLTLPEQRTPKGRRFSIEGIVDIVREDDEVWMYDIKTHDLDFVMANKHLYEKQLNVYGYIWSQLRQNQLDHTAIISTAFPMALKRAWQENDLAKAMHEMEKWNPLVEIESQPENVKSTINDFAAIVDEIEENHFEPASLVTLQTEWGNSGTKFATRVCRNCDARFSCESYRRYMLGTGDKGKASFKKYIEDIAPEGDQEEWLNASLSATNFDNLET